MPNAGNRKAVIGLIGGIGAGKSTVAAAFAARGGHVVNADALGHEALEHPHVRASLLARWADRGSLIRPDGTLDRRAIGRIVFQDDAERQALQELVFPIIGQRAREEITKAQHEPGVRFVVLDAAVMLEAGWNDACDHLLFVDAPRQVRLERLQARSGWSEDELVAREAAQMSNDEKRRRADAILVNDGDTATLQTQVDDLLRRWNLL
jgi:dephospho-CoA kinase